MRRERALSRSRSQRVVTWILIALVLAATAYFVYAGSRPAEPLASPQVIALGAEVYSANCASCHGDQGQGHALIAEAPALDDSEHAWHHPGGQIQDLLLNGGQAMPAFGNTLSDEEPEAVIRYIQTWWTAEQLATQQEASQGSPLH